MSPRLVKRGEQSKQHEEPVQQRPAPEAVVRGWVSSAKAAKASHNPRAAFRALFEEK